MNESAMTLARDWQGQDPTGWYITEKLDGCRAYWDGRHLWTRGGQIIKAPRRITRYLPSSMHLDGEIWAGRGNFEEARLAVQNNKWEIGCEFYAFDCPTIAAEYPKRIACIPACVSIVPKVTCKNRSDLLERLKLVQRNSGEGIVIRHPTARYEIGRTNNVLKVKYIIP